MGGASSASLQPGYSAPSRHIPSPGGRVTSSVEYPRQNRHQADNTNNSARNPYGTDNYSANHTGRVSAVPEVTVQGNGHGQWIYPPQDNQRRPSNVSVSSGPLAKGRSSPDTAEVKSREQDTSLDDEISRCIAADQSQDTSMDITLSRVMAADEFLLRMEETDRGIGQMALYAEREATYGAVKEAVGLRGHLQDELLRIEGMLAADDPELHRLAMFESSFPRVVSKLRELHEKGKLLRAISDAPDGGAGGEGSLNQPFAVSTLDPNLMRTIQFHIMPNEESMDEDDEEDNITEPEQLEDKLKVKHVKEEEAVTENFAQRITGARGSSSYSRGMSQNDVDAVLQEHLVSMQALRTKQDMEKARVQKKVQKRLLERREQVVKVEAPPPIQPITNKQFVAGISFGAGRNVLPPIDGGKIGPTSSGSRRYEDEDTSDDDEDFNSDDELQDIIAKSCLKKTRTGDEDEDDFGETEMENAANLAMRAKLQDEFENNKKMTSEDFKSLMDEFRKQKEEDEKREAGKSEQGTNTDNRHPVGVSISCGDDGSTDEDGVGVGVGADMESEDKDFVSRIKNDRNITDEEFNDLMKRHLAASQALKRVRHGENNKYDEMLAEKLNKRTDDKELVKLEEEFRGELSRKRKELSEQDLAAMLAQYRKQQQSIINKRNSEKSRTDDLLQAKLEQREKQRQKKKAKKQNSLELLSQIARPQDLAAIFEMAAKNGSCDEKFFHELQRMRGGNELTEDVFQELLKNYLNSAQKEKRTKKRSNKDSGLEEVRQEASTLMHEHEANRKQIHNIRQRERKAFDDRLQERLASKT